MEVLQIILNEINEQFELRRFVSSYMLYLTEQYSR